MPIELPLPDQLLVERSFPREAVLFEDSFVSNIKSDTEDLRIELFQLQTDLQLWSFVNVVLEETNCGPKSNKFAIPSSRQEVEVNIVSQFVGLRSKMYTNTTGATNVKGVIKSVIKKNMFQDDYKLVLLNTEQRMVRQTTITSSPYPWIDNLLQFTGGYWGKGL